MLICVPEVLSKKEVADFRLLMDGYAWEDGRSTAGAQSAMSKATSNCRRTASWRASSATASSRR